MCYVRRILSNRAIAGVFENRKTKRPLFVFSPHTWIIFFVLVTGSQLAFATTAPSPGKFHIQWSTPKFIHMVDKNHARFLIKGKTKPGVTIQLKHHAVLIDAPNKVSDLTTNEMAPSATQITVDASGNFKIYLTLPLKHVEIPFKATDRQLLVKHYILAVLLNRPRFTPSSRWNFGLEARSVAYSQTNLNNLNETMLALDVAYQHTFTKQWSIKAQSLIDIAGAIPFSTSQNEMYARYWHGDFDGIYALPLSLHKWSINIAGGLYYMTMLPSGFNFGYGDLWGPEIYPILRYSLDNKNAFGFYFKYAPNMSQFSPNFKNHESAAGFEWTKFYSNKQCISFKVGFLQDSFNNGDQATQSNAINFGISMGIP